MDLKPSLEENRQLKILADADALARDAADRFKRLSHIAIMARGIFTVALSGGSTPKKLHTLLSQTEPFKSEIDWGSVHFFFGDERNVPSESAESNFLMAKETLFSRVSVPEENIHRVKTELGSAAAAEEYEQEIERFFTRNKLAHEGWPRFDLIFLGMGADGHTASLFPGTTALQEKERKVVSTWVEVLKSDRITMTYPVLNNAAQVILLIAGADKAERIEKIFQSEYQEINYPVKRIIPEHGRKIWLLDEAAAALLTTETRERYFTGDLKE